MLLSVGFLWFVDAATGIHLFNEEVILLTFDICIGKSAFQCCFGLAPYFLLVSTILYMPCPSFVTVLHSWFVLTGGMKYFSAYCVKYRVLCGRFSFPF